MTLQQKISQSKVAKRQIRICIASNAGGSGKTTAAVIQERAESLRTKGQLTPIIVIPNGDRYKLFEGELRWRGAQKLQWNELDAVFLTSAESLNATEIFERQVDSQMKMP